MQYDCHQPEKPGKGECAKLCNVRACQKEGAVFRHVHSGAYYCTSCAMRINSVAYRAGEQSLCYPDKQAMQKYLQECNEMDREVYKRIWRHYFNFK